MHLTARECILVLRGPSEYPGMETALKSKLLDLYCGAGGAGMGYHLAGFDVVGVDINPQPRYPFRFIRADALEYLREHGHEYDAIHASPPCQRYSITAAATGRRDQHPDLIPPTRWTLQSVGRPYIIENVVGAPLKDPIRLCGLQFGLRVLMHRLFETSFPVPEPLHPRHPANPRKGQILHKGTTDDLPFLPKQWTTSDIELAAAAGITWMHKNEARQAIPPAYTAYIAPYIPRSL